MSTTHSETIKRSSKTDQFEAPDYYVLDELLTEEHLLIRSSVRAWVKKEVTPIIESYTENAECPLYLYKQMGELGALGPSLPEKYGCGGMDEITPRLAKGEIIGCFGLTEPNHGSDPSSMITNFKEDGDDYILNGAKMWITNSPVADIAIVWAKSPEGIIRGFIVERGMKGFTAPEIKGKWSLRASITGEIVLEDVRVPKENMLPEVQGLKGPLSCLSKARYGISWGAIGAAMDCYDAALRYSKERTQFGKPLGQFQLTQKKLAEMITEITKAQLLAWRLGSLANNGKATPSQISMAKRNNVWMALQIAREARQIHGGMGITNEYPMMRHMCNLETVLTYEGTHDIHLLITGMDVTGLNAFK